jgi:predicted negative regulator of RcsB-dependent stress response
MADYSEEEQVEMIRKWWAENGVGVIVAIVVAVSALLGWRYWQDYQGKQGHEASTLYQEMTTNLEALRGVDAAQAEQATQAVEQSAERLLADFSDSAYADYASLTLARLAVESGDYAAAVKHLQVVVDDPESDSLKWIATLRLARVHVQLGEYDAAKGLLANEAPAAFEGQVQELKGDILFASDDIDGARKAYAAALESTEGEAQRELVKMKLQDLAPAS